jgi:hypothetical protein
MITTPGLYLVSVNESNNPTYIHDGLYRVYVDHPYANFRNVRTGGGTFERLSLLNQLQRQGRISITPVASHREQLEADLVAFEAWSAA